jgi:conjugal transfer pilus assembly protein TraF
MAEARIELEEALNLAILEPTEENVADYMRLQKRWVDQSAGFAQTWQRVLLSDPLLNETVGNPTSQYGSQVSKERRRRDREALIQDLTHSYGLLFLYEGDSLESQAMAQVVALLHDKYAWDYLPISVDGKYLSVFESSYPANDLVAELGVSTFPALLLLDPDSRQVVPIGFGVLALEQVERNIQLQFSKERA